MGLPSIVTDINGSREIIAEGKNGTIIQSRDSHAIYTAMRRFVTDYAYVNALAANARPMIASRFEQDYVRSCLKAYYKEIIQKSSSK